MITVCVQYLYLNLMNPFSYQFKNDEHAPHDSLDLYSAAVFYNARVFLRKVDGALEGVVFPTNQRALDVRVDIALGHIIQIRIVNRRVVIVRPPQPHANVIGEWAMSNERSNSKHPTVVFPLNKPEDVARLYLFQELASPVYLFRVNSP